MHSPTLAKLFAAPQPGADYRLCGWLRSKRQSTNVLFLVLSDGSTQATLQAVADPSAYPAELLQQLSVGASVALEGKLIDTPQAAQPYELQLQKITLLGAADAKHYPLQPKAHSYAFLRSIAHMRLVRLLLDQFLGYVMRLVMRYIAFFTKRAFFRYTRLSLLQQMPKALAKCLAYVPQKHLIL